MFRHILLASLIAVGMSSCTVAVMAGAPGVLGAHGPLAAVASAR
jgi:hypothetical protein